MRNETALQTDPIVYYQEKADAIRKTIMKLQDTYAPSAKTQEAKDQLIQLYREELEWHYQQIEKALK